MNSLISKTVIAFMSLLILSCDKHEVQKLSNTYYLQETSLYPEGIQYSSLTEKVYIGSYFKGKIITMDLYGNINDFVIDDNLVAVVGIAIDEKNNRILVCNSDAGISLKSDDSTIGQLAEVISYDLRTGKKLQAIDLSELYQGANFLNDLVLDDNGNIYVTDSFSPVIYKIDKNNIPSVLISSERFSVPQGAFGLNGIVFHHDNYLIVGKSFGGILYKIPLDSPKDFQEIEIGTSVNSLDGLLLSNNVLLLASNNFTGAPFDEAVYRIETSNNWNSGNIKNIFTDLDGIYPTTLTEINNGLFVNFGYFPELIDPNSTPNDNFKLQKVVFSD